MNAAKKQLNMGDVSVFSYLDYRQYLENWVEEQNSATPGFSLRKFSDSAGLSAGFLPQVFSRKKSLSTKSTPKVAKALKLNLKEARFFELLVQLAESKQQKDRLKALENIQKFDEFKAENPEELKMYRYLSRWYYVAIKELVTIPGFVVDPKQIQKKLKFHVSVKNINRALKYLEEIGLIKIKDDNTVDDLKPNIACKDGIFQILLGNLHQSMFYLASEAVDKVEKDERKMVGYTYAIDEDSFSELKDILDETLKKVASLEQKSKMSSDKNVYHVELSAIPLSGSST